MPEDLAAAETDESLTLDKNKATTTIKALPDKEGRVGGYLVVWGNSAQKDLQNEYFTPETDLGLELYDRRPMLYHHAQDDTVKAETIGVIDTLTPDETGLWAEAQLDLHKRYVQAVRKLIDKGALAWSSGSLTHLVKKAADGCIQRWWIVEGSATPIPAEPRYTDIAMIKMAYKELGLDTAPLELQDNTGDVLETPDIPAPIDDASPAAIEPPAKEPANAEETGSDLPSEDPSQEENDMDTQNVVMAVIDAVLNALNESLDDSQRAQLAQTVMASMQQPEQNMDAARSAEVAAEIAPAVTKAVSEFLAAQQQQQTAVNGAAQTAVKNLLAGMVPQPRVTSAVVPQPDQTPTGARIQVTRANKYSNLSAEDLGYFYDFMRRGSRANNGAEVWQPSAELLRTMADKAIKAVNDGRFTIGEDAVKAVHFLADQTVALKAGDELDYSTQSGYGDQWVPDLWASSIWDKARLDNVIAREVNMIDMPSNPFELPSEGADPTPYHVPETADEAHLDLASGNPFTKSKAGTGKVQLSAEKVGIQVGWSNELVEDSIIPVISQFRGQAQRALQDAVDNVMANGDTVLTINTNLNLIDDTPGGTEVYTTANGMIKQAIITTTANAVDGGGGAISLALMRQARGTLASQYITPASMLRWFVDPQTYLTVLNIPEILTAAEYYGDATVIKGDVRIIDGIPIYPSEQIALANSAGKISATPGNNILGRATLVRPSMWYLGYKRRPTVSVEYLPYYDAYVMTATLRMATGSFDNDNVSVIYDLAV